MTLSYAKGPETPAVRDLTIGDALREAAAAAPDRIALIDGNADPAQRREWTYRELLDEAECLARALLARFKPGERIAIWAPNLPQWVITEYGAALAGVILVTVNPSYQPEEVKYVLNQSRAAGILVMREFRGNRMAAHVESVRGECPELREVMLFEEWDSLIDEGRTSDAALPDLKPEDPIMIQYTSGTTGFPKGALLHHRGLVNNAAHTALGQGQSDGDTLVAIMPLFHTSGCVLAVLGTLAVRGTLVLPVMFDPGLTLELAESYKSCGLFGVPTMLIALMEHPDFKTRDLSAMRLAASGGSTVPAALVQRLEEQIGIQFVILFGQTECSPVASMTHPVDSTDDKATTLGRAMPNTEIKIIDPETGETVPFGQKGEYCTRGYHVMLEYFDNPEATASTIDKEGWLHTGDLCSMDDRGYTKIEGRLKDMIIRGGENIYPREIEELLFKHDTIAEVAVVGLPDEKYGEIVGAFLRVAPDETLDRDALFAYCREFLSPQKTPTKWFEVSEFPLTGSGKIQKFVLCEQWESGALAEL